MSAAAPIPWTWPHTKDEDCAGTVRDGVCLVCDVLHGDPCLDCGAAAYHLPGCEGLVEFDAADLLHFPRRDEDEQPAPETGEEDFDPYDAPPDPDERDEIAERRERHEDDSDAD